MTIHFEDRQLETGIRIALGRFEGPLSAEELSAVTVLDGTRRGIGSLRGIEALVNLRILRLDHNHIHDLSPLAVMSGLRELWLYDNEVTDLGPLASLTNLRSLDIGIPFPEPNTINVSRKMNITDIGPLAGLVQLQYLSLTGSRPGSFDPLESLAGLLTLKLTCTGAEPPDLSFLNKLGGLRDLDLSHNDVSARQIPSMPGLRRLRVGRGQNVVSVFFDHK